MLFVFFVFHESLVERHNNQIKKIKSLEQTASVNVPNYDHN